MFLTRVNTSASTNLPMAMTPKRKLDAPHSSVKSIKTSHWSMGLKASIDDPELRVDADEKVIIIKDKYPKAKFHFLILPRESIPNIKGLTVDHLPLLKHMDKCGRDVADKSSKTHQFRFGYHAIPSMSHVHMHVISQDFNSPCMKTKKHWNSFTTEYFIDSKDIIKQLENNGKVFIDGTKAAELLKRNLVCHVCKKEQKTIPALKLHLLTHENKDVSTDS